MIQMKIAVGIATAGRREILSETLLMVCRQSRLPDRLIVCPSEPGDCDSAIPLPVKLEIVSSARGSCAQRNAILDAAADVDVVVFFDDDFFPAPDFLKLLEMELALRPSAAIVTGTLLADDILGPGLSPDQAKDVISKCGAARADASRMTEVYNAYGCNMAVRMSKVRAIGARFDEALPLYGWLEDVDFSRSLACLGEVLKSSALRGVHLGAKAGRTSGLRFGYSQIANPIYLWRKGALTFRLAFRQMARNMAANLAKVFYPEPWVDRGGRLNGNLYAISDLILGRLAPRRILDFQDTRSKFKRPIG